MSTRTLYTPSALEVLTAANMKKLAGGWLGYVLIDTPQGAVTSEVDVTSATLTVTVPAARLLRISFSANVNSDVAGDTALVNIKEGATTLGGGLSAGLLTNATGIYAEALVSAPSTGSHTYKATIQRATGTGSMTLGGSATRPMVFVVEDVGPSS